MALKVERRGTTSTSIDTQLPLCHTCRVRKPGLFTVDVYMKPQCADCARAIGRPIPHG